METVDYKQEYGTLVSSIRYALQQLEWVRSSSAPSPEVTKEVIEGINIILNNALDNAVQPIITDIKIRKTFEDGRQLKALASMTLDDTIVVNDIKVIEGRDRYLVAMPNRQDSKGVFYDIVFPKTSSARKQIEDRIMDAYDDYIEARSNSQEII